MSCSLQNLVYLISAGPFPDVQSDEVNRAASDICRREREGGAFLITDFPLWNLDTAAWTTPPDGLILPRTLDYFAGPEDYYAALIHQCGSIHLFCRLRDEAQRDCLELVERICQKHRSVLYVHTYF